MVDLSICIVNWNAREHLRRCLASLDGHVGVATREIIVVDNASSDDSAEMVRREFPQVRLIAAGENLGFGRANNRAFAEARGRYLFALNPDTIVLENACDVLVRFADAHPDAGVVGPKLLNSDGSVQRSCWRGFPSLRTALVDALYLWRFAPSLAWVPPNETSAEGETATVVDHILGAAMLVRAEIYRTVGGMDEGFFLFFEETDWCFRIGRQGWKVYFVPEAEIIHLGQRSVHLDPEGTMPKFYENLVRFYRDHQSTSSLRAAALKSIIALACLIRIGLWTWRGRLAAGRDQARRMRRSYGQVLRQLSLF